MKDAPIDWSGRRAVPGTISVTVPSQAALLSDIEARLEAGQGARVATLNLDHVVKLGRDPAFRDAYLGQSHVTADGNPIVWLSRLAGHDVALTTGADLVDPLCALAARRGWLVAFLGATDDALAAAADDLTRRHPGLDVALRFAPPMGFDPDGPGAEDAIDRIGASGARLCFLALGAPKQERFAARAGRALPGIAFLSVGAALDFHAGTQQRAPRLIQHLAMEWLWRLGRNPGRLARRYGACFAILPRLAMEARRSRPADPGRTGA